MMLIEETAVPQAALPLEGFKAHLRLGTGFSDGDIQDVVLESFLRAAIAAIEARTGKILIERSLSWTMTRWRDASGQPLPVAPVKRIVSVKLRDRADDEELIDASAYRLEADSQRPVLSPIGTCLPVIPMGGVVEITFEAGFSEDWFGLPADLGHAVILLAASYYENRDATHLSGTAIPHAVSTLIERYRTVRLLAGGRS
ncbi:MAG: hypothetical protein AAF678_00725 [Pseudomonadota bacterium]